MARLDKITAAQLDDELSRMTDEQRAELSRMGGRIMKGVDTPEGREKQAAYMMRYKARIALAASRGLITGNEEQR